MNERSGLLTPVARAGKGIDYLRDESSRAGGVHPERRLIQSHSG